MKNLTIASKMHLVTFIQAFWSRVPTYLNVRLLSIQSAKTAEALILLF
jgi:hypothetical protein